jgi:transcription-repair coupling factor (superfamily II helicase)
MRYNAAPWNRSIQTTSRSAQCALPCRACCRCWEPVTAECAAWAAVGPLQALLISSLVERLTAKSLPLVAVVADEQTARTLRKDLQFFLHRGHNSDDPAASDAVIGLPELDVTPWADASPSEPPCCRGCRRCFGCRKGSVLSAQVVVASVEALARRVVPKDAFADLVDIIAAEEELDRDQTIKRLLQGGYTRAPVCEDPGTLAVRGGVLDVFVPLYRFPVRIEFYGDLVETLRFYDPSSQRTLRKTDEIYLHPVRETILTRGHKLRERLLEVGDLAVHPSSRTRQILEQIEAGRGLLRRRVADSGFSRADGVDSATICPPRRRSCWSSRIASSTR